jgi:hypothetical protein
MRHLVANNIKHLIKSDKINRNNKLAKNEWNILNIKQKVENNNLIITQADKGKTIVIMQKQHYEQYILGFLNQTQFTPITHDPTKTFQRKVQSSTDTTTSIKTKVQIYNHNPEPPSIRALVKLHKTPTSIRPIINWTHAPAYQLATRIALITKQFINFPNTYIVNNKTDLITDLNEIKINQDTRICSFDIANMYTNIPTDIIIDLITETLHKQDTPIQITREIILIIGTILDQNYFVHNHQIFQQHEGLPMGAPASAILLELYLEHNNILNILSKHHIVSYNRYVDDILIIYNQTRTNIEEVLEEFNKIHKILQFTMEQENNNTIKYLRHFYPKIKLQIGI